MKYPIGKEFFPYSCFYPPVPTAKFAGFIGSLMRPPKWIWKDPAVKVTAEKIRSFDGGEIRVLVFEPYGLEAPSPCLVYYHGGGFMFGGSWHHYKIAMHYALKVGCKVVFVQYRLAPKYPHPIPAKDCYATLCWTYENAERFQIDKHKIAVGGDSAGGALAAAVCQMMRDREREIPLFQLLVYPVTDRRMATDSHRKYTDTPMWNSKLSVKMWNGYVPDPNASDIAYASPMEAAQFDHLPDAYVETAEFDCLHDEAIAYARALADAGSQIELNETQGTIHGFDAATKTVASQMAIAARIEYMKRKCH